MPLLDRSGWVEDPYTRSEDAAAGAAQLVPLVRAAAALTERLPGHSIGVEIANDTDPDALRALLGGVSLIAIAFPAPGDGRGFSLARSIRGEGFAGTLRAVGALIPDQLPFALQCGFDEVEISTDRAERQPIAQWLQALDAIGESYQAGAGTSIFAKRKAAA